MAAHKLSDPLSWPEARLRLRQTLENYLKEEPSKPTLPAEAQEPPNRSILAIWIHYDLDVYAGSVLIAVALLLVSCVSFLARTDRISNNVLKADAAIDVYKAQLAASVLLLVGALISLSMVRSRKQLWLNDEENAKRRTIRSFLRKIDRCKSSETAETADMAFEMDKMNLQGTSLTDSYPVYRVSHWNRKTMAAWSRVPSLLLVHGDVIALQIGDIAPATCSLTEETESTVLYQAGDTVKTALIHDDLNFSKLPNGRSTIPTKSELFLPLCNGMRLFIVTKTPLETFLRRRAAILKPSESSRQLTELRKLLFTVACMCFLLTALISLARAGAGSGDLSLVLPLPLLAALGVLPIVGPAFLFVTEMLGTARILATVHKYAGQYSEKADFSCLIGPKLQTFSRYLVATVLARLSLWQVFISISDVLRMFLPIRPNMNDMVRVPPVSQCLLEKLGVATCFSVVDDHIVCEPHAIPQQLVIPSARGLKLLDLCLNHDEDSDNDSDDSGSSSSDSSENEAQFLSLRRRSAFGRRAIRNRTTTVMAESSQDLTESTIGSSYEVQFEDPGWWQYLPNLRGIGLAALVVDENRDATTSLDVGEDCGVADVDLLSFARSSLIPFVCRERKSNQLRALAQCIGFSLEPNTSGDRGDLSPFTEKLRLHLLSNSLVKERLEIDAHERGSEQSRWWGYVRPDATSVVIQDSRSKAYQVLTVGDPSVVVDLCHEAWQGEISTILPLSSGDRQTILDTTSDWKLADLDVAAFAYSPLPRTLESRIDDDEDKAASTLYLFDGTSDPGWTPKNKNVSQEWSLAKNQVFLGVLGSLVVPKGEMQKLLKTLGDAGVRFVYFSPRNMRRQKELAIQLSIDVSWNAAISLRPLESGAEDPHRMTSAYADWDVNARLPHGVDDVRKHLEEVDNVPLLVSLFTDVTKQTTRDMIGIFQEYFDTVIAVGSTVPWNDSIFSTADVAVGIDIFDEVNHDYEDASVPLARGSELEFVSGISAHSCAFRFRGTSSVSHLSDIMQQGRAALAACTTACLFLVHGSLAFSFFVLLSTCTPATAVPFVPILGTALFLQVILPIIGLAICMTDPEPTAMKHVPPKNDQSITFRRREGKTLYTMLIAKAILPALLSAIMWLIAYGRLVFHLERDFVLQECSPMESWVIVLRCDAMQYYSGPARISSGILSLSHLALCVIVGSASFVYRFRSISEQLPFSCNHAWVVSCILGVAIIALYLAIGTASGARSALPWYYYCLSIINPILCLIWNELCKMVEVKTERRSEKVRRLQFETRLGAFSPK